MTVALEDPARNLSVRNLEIEVAHNRSKPKRRTLTCNSMLGPACGNIESNSPSPKGGSEKEDPKNKSLLSDAKVT